MLPALVSSRRSGGIGLERPVGALQETVLIEVPRFDAPGTDSQLDPPHR